MIKSLVEKNALGKLPDERFYALLDVYEREQKELAKALSELDTRLQQARDEVRNAERFVALVVRHLPRLLRTGRGTAGKTGGERLMGKQVPSVVSDRPLPISHRRASKSLFSKQVAKPVEGGERIVLIPRDRLAVFGKHPFTVDRTAQKYISTRESIREHGIYTPLIVRPAGDRFEVLAGYHRWDIATVEDIPELPCVVRELDDDMAVIAMVDTNKQTDLASRKPSELARALALRGEAVRNLRAQGRLQSGAKTRDAIGDELDMDGRTVARYLKLNGMNPALLELVDRGKSVLPLQAASDQLAFLSEQEQAELAGYLGESGQKTTMKRAKRLRGLSEQGEWDMDLVREVYEAPNPPTARKNRFIMKFDRCKLPGAWADLSPEELEERIYRAVQQVEGTA